MDYPAGTPMPGTDAATGRLVPSTSDQRVVNNVMRHAYRVLSDDEKKQMQALKDKGLEFISLLHQIGGTYDLFSTAHPQTTIFQMYRELEEASKKIEEAVMWAVKHVTR